LYAKERGLDLVEVSPNAKPPVCKVLDYGKYKYHQSKVDHKQKVKQRHNKLKEIRLSPRISHHDLDTKAKKAIDFLKKGFRVKVNLQFRGREMMHKDVGIKQMKEFTEMISEYAVIDGEVKHQGYQMFGIFKPHHTPVKKEEE
jgi:translation initiation factor IF-3